MTLLQMKNLMLESAPDRADGYFFLSLIGTNWPNNQSLTLRKNK
jgi:hypothetical protein